MQWSVSFMRVSLQWLQWNRGTSGIFWSGLVEGGSAIFFDLKRLLELGQLSTAELACTLFTFG
jgi:hypothetical protein